MTLSIVIPAYNEEENIEKCVREVHQYFPDSEIVVIDDGSTDNTLQILQLLRLRIPNLRFIANGRNRGHGYSVIEGMRAATGHWILYIDADRQIDITEVPQGYDFYSGWRVHRNDKLFRKVISFCLKTTNLLRHRMYIKDANCPYKLYRRSSLLPLLDELPESYVIPIACLEVLARKHKLKTYTVKTPHKPYDGVRQGFLQIPNLKVLKFCAAAMKEISSI